jgi:hypothetical protein
LVRPDGIEYFRRHSDRLGFGPETGQSGLYDATADSDVE